jgi:hypothetical protein
MSTNVSKLPGHARALPRAVSRALPLLPLLPLLLGVAVPCAAQTIPVAKADVDRDCTVTRTDATIAQALNGKRCGQSGFNANADVNGDCVINSIDITFITRNVGAQVCSVPPAPPTIVATIAPAPNGNGWNNGDVTVSFACTNATSCPAPVTITTEGAAQIVERSVSNSAGVTATARTTVSIDKTPPVITPAVPASALPGMTVTMPLSVTDLSGVAQATLLVRRVVADAKTAAPFALSWQVPTDAGSGYAETLDFFAEDRAGNVASQRRSLPIEAPDTVPPTVRVTAPPIAAPGAKIPVVVDAADDRALTRVTLSQTVGTATTPLQDRNAGPFSFQAIAQIPADAADGTVVAFPVVATDAGSNRSTASAMVTVTTHVAATELKITVDPIVSPTFQSTAVVTGVIGDAAGSAPPPATPIIASVAPQSGRQGETVDLVITGINTTFSNASQVSLGTGLAVLSVTANDGATLTARVAIAADAPVGPRLMAVSTGAQQGLLASAFSVLPGRGTVTGRLLDSRGNPVADARVCLPDGVTCVTSGADGRFTFDGVSVDVHRVTVSASGFDTATVAIAPGTGTTSALGDVALVTGNQPPPPPLPNSPPVPPKLATVLGRGATEIGTGGNIDQARALVRDAIIAIGGRELGVLDANGNQLNPLMTGAGYASFTDEAVTEIANDMIAGDTVSLTELFRMFMGSIEFPSTVKKPTLAQLIAGFQDAVNVAWANPARPDSPLLFLLFNQGRVVSPTPPRINFDTVFNPLQKQVAIVSFAMFVNRAFSPPSTASLRTDPSRGAPRGASGSRWAGTVRTLASLLTPRPPSAFTSARGSVTARWRPKRPMADRALSWVREAADSAEQSNTPSPYLPPDDYQNRPVSWLWDGVMEKILPDGGWTVAKNLGKYCDQALVYIVGGTPVDAKSPEGKALAKDPTAKFMPAPSCKDAITLTQALVSGGIEMSRKASDNFVKFVLAEGETAANAERLRQTFNNKGVYEGWKEAKKAASDLGKLTKVAKFAGSLVETVLTKLQGEMVNLLFKQEIDLVLQSVRPRPPFIKSIEQVTNPETDPPSPSRIVKITATRSPNDPGVYDDPAIVWRYELYRGRNGAIEYITTKRFKEADPTIVFYDEVPADGTYVYRVRGLRTVGKPLLPGKEDPTTLDSVVTFVAGFVPSTVTTYDGVAVISTGVVSAIGDPMVTLAKGLNKQTSDFSDPEQIYVSTRPPTPRPPASLAVHPWNGSTYLSVPALKKIFRVDETGVRPFVDPNFKEPGQNGLAIDSRGDLYSDNAASDAEFGGRIFQFRGFDGLRSLAGTANYYSLLLQFANPVTVDSMLIASGGATGESMFIADSLNQRITRLTLPFRFAPGVTPERNVSQPYATSPLFQFGPSTTMAMRNDSTLAITQDDNVLLVSDNGAFVDPLFGAGGASPFSQLSGVTFDTASNMYVSDSVLGTITMIPKDKQRPGEGLLGLTDIDKKKLTVVRGSRRPSDIKLSADRDGLVFYDGERAYDRIHFGMSGQITDAGGSPLSGAQVYVAAKKTPPAVTDSDGIYVLPELVARGESPIIDFVIRYDGKTQTNRVVLNTSTHNIVDAVFNPPAPPPPTPAPPPTIDPPVAQPPKPQPADEGTVAMVLDLKRSEELNPSCPRGLFIAPGFGVGTTSTSATVSGALTLVTLRNATLVVNGSATVVPVDGGLFSTSAPLRVGENVMTIGLPASVLKPIGCADASLADTELVIVSDTHKVFHDPRPDEVQRYRASLGWDLAVRGFVREGGRAMAGLGFHVPGTQWDASTDGDGVFQINLPAATVGGTAGVANALSSGLSSRLGMIVSLLRTERRAESLDALKSLLQQANAVTDAPPGAATTVDTLLSVLLTVEGTASRLVVSLESADGIPDPADIDALESLGTQLGGLDNHGEIVVRGREFPELSVTVRLP